MDRKRAWDVKSIAGEEVAEQHQPLICDKMICTVNYYYRYDDDDEDDDNDDDDNDNYYCYCYCYYYYS